MNEKDYIKNLTDIELLWLLVIQTRRFNSWYSRDDEWDVYNSEEVRNEIHRRWN